MKSNGVCCSYVLGVSGAVEAGLLVIETEIRSAQYGQVRDLRAFMDKRRMFLLCLTQRMSQARYERHLPGTDQFSGVLLLSDTTVLDKHNK